MNKRVLSYVMIAIISAAVGSLFQPFAHFGAMAQQGCQTFPQTNKTVCGKFLQYWQAHGDLPQQGYPISNEFTEVSELNGRAYTVQYFERAVFELHPENAPPYDMLLSQLGTFQLKRKYPNGDPPPAGNPSISNIISVDNVSRVQESKLLQSDGWVGYLAFAPNTSVLAWAGVGDIWLYDVGQDQVLRRLPGHDGLVHTAVFSPDSSLLYSGGLDNGGGKVRVWDWRNGSQVGSAVAAPPGWGVKAGISADGRWLGTSGNGQTALWQVNREQLQRIYELGQGNGPVFSTQGDITFWSEGGVRLRSIGSTESRLLAAPDVQGYDPDVAFSPDGSLVAVGAADHNVWLWRVSDGKLLWKGQGHTGQVTGVAFSPDGQLLASASGDGTIRLWRVADGTSLRTLAHREALKVAFSPDGKTLVSGGLDEVVRVWRVR